MSFGPRGSAVVASFLLSVLIASPSEAVRRRAFVTSVAGSAHLATWPDAGGQVGLAAGDQVCRNRAAAAGLPNAAAYRAWLSTSTTDAFCHVQGLTGKKSGLCGGAPLPGAGPWFLVNGITNFTPSLAVLTGPDRLVYRSVYFDEFGDVVPQAWNQREYWTGTQSDGVAWPADTCGDWTSASAAAQGQTGEAHATAVRWSDSFLRNCDQPRRLLCLEPGASETVTLKWSPGAIVFVTSAQGPGQLGAWPEAEGQVGVSAGYRICRHLAEQAHLPQPASFVPWLSTEAVDARERVTTDGPFRRIDAYTVASDFADLIDGTLDNSMHVFEDGTYASSKDLETWTGTLADGTLGASNCGNWTDGTTGEFGRSGAGAYAGVPEWTHFNGFVCTLESRLYCVSNVITLFWDGFDLTGDTSRWSSATP